MIAIYLSLLMGVAYYGNHSYWRPYRQYKKALKSQRWYQREQRKLQLQKEEEQLTEQQFKEVEAFAKSFARRFVDECARLGFYHQHRKGDDFRRERMNERVQKVEVKDTIIMRDGFYYALRMPWGVNIYRHVLRDDVLQHLRLVLHKPDLEFVTTPDMGLFAKAGVYGRADAIPEFFPWRSSKTISTAMQYLSKVDVDYTFPVGMASNRTFVHYNLVKDMQPHMLVAGITGGGKSNFLNQMICSYIATCTPDILHLYIVDLKRNEFFSYEPLIETGQLKDIIKTPDGAMELIETLTKEMERRYKLLAEHKQRNLHSYNKEHPSNKLPYIIFIIDELQLLMLTKGNEAVRALMRIGMEARAAGIHMVLCTQRPAVSVVPNEIKSQCGTILCFRVDKADTSRVILGHGGAEKLPGDVPGRAIFRDGGQEYEVQVPRIEDDQIEKTVAAVIERDMQGAEKISQKRLQQLKKRRPWFKAYEMAQEEDPNLSQSEFINRLMGGLNG